MNTSASKDKADSTIMSPAKDDAANNVGSRGHCTQDYLEKPAEAKEGLRQTLNGMKAFDN